MKKANLSIQMIISIALALIVFVVMIFILSDKGGTAEQDIHSCETKGGECVSSAKDCEQSLVNFECPEGMVCCLSLV